MASCPAVFAGSSPLARGLLPPRRLDGRPCGIIPARAGSTPHLLVTHPRVQGSSPLARGLRPDRRPVRRRDGIIPARAGSTLQRKLTSPPSTDHPRSRGVYTRLGTSLPCQRGSSPLARGLLSSTFHGAVNVGIIPARAGSTLPPTPQRQYSPDHPRSRGVYSLSVRTRLPHRGSSPLARGLRLDLLRHTVGRGIIPARAGSTTTSR